MTQVTLNTSSGPIIVKVDENKTHLLQPPCLAYRNSKDDRQLTIAKNSDGKTINQSLTKYLFGNSSRRRSECNDFDYTSSAYINNPNSYRPSLPNDVSPNTASTHVTLYFLNGKQDQILVDAGFAYKFTPNTLCSRSESNGRIYYTVVKDHLGRRVRSRNAKSKTHGIAMTQYLFECFGTRPDTVDDRDFRACVYTTKITLRQGSSGYFIVDKHNKILPKLPTHQMPLLDDDDGHEWESLESHNAPKDSTLEVAQVVSKQPESSVEPVTSPAPKPDVQNGDTVQLNGITMTVSDARKLLGINL